MVKRDKLGKFTKECVGKENIFYGKHHTKKVRENQKDFMKQNWENPEYRENQIKKKKGRHYSPETEFKKGLIPWSKTQKGIHLSPQSEFKKGQTKGKNNSNWKGGITPLNRLLRASSEYKIWRESVFLRDNFTCQNSNCKFCHNKIGGKLHAHHIKTFSKYPKLRFDINNGITLCEKFHKKIKGKEEKYIKTCEDKIRKFK